MSNKHLTDEEMVIVERAEIRLDDAKKAQTAIETALSDDDAPLVCMLNSALIDYWGWERGFQQAVIGRDGFMAYMALRQRDKVEDEINRLARALALEEEWL